MTESRRGSQRFDATESDVECPGLVRPGWGRLRASGD